MKSPVPVPSLANDTETASGQKLKLPSGTFECVEQDLRAPLRHSTQLFQLKSPVATPKSNKKAIVADFSSSSSEPADQELEQIIEETEELVEQL